MTGTTQTLPAETGTSASEEDREPKLGVAHPEIAGATALVLIDAAPDGIVMADEHGEILFANRHVEELFGYDRHDLIELRCDVEPEIADTRVERRRHGGHDASDADRTIAAALRAAADPWPQATTVDTSGSPAAALEMGWSATQVRSGQDERRTFPA